MRFAWPLISAIVREHATLGVCGCGGAQSRRSSKQLDDSLPSTHRLSAGFRNGHDMAILVSNDAKDSRVLASLPC